MTRIPASAVALAALAISWSVSAVRADPGFEARLTLSQGLKSIEKSGGTIEPGDEGFRSTTALDFGLTSVTSYQRFGIGVGADLDYIPDAADTFSTSREVANLGYEIQSRQSQFNIDLGYRSVDIEDSVFLDELTGEDVIADDGRREIVSISSALLMGREAPLSFSLRQQQSESRYTDTTDPDLRDSTSRSVAAELGLRVSPLVTLKADASWSDYDQDGPDGNWRTTRRAGLGASYQLSPITALSAGINYSTNRTDDQDDSDGLGYSLGLRQTRPNGTVDLSLSSFETVNGTRSEFSLGRSLDFSWGVASLAVGASKTGGFEAQPTINGRIDYTLDKLSSFNLALSQAAVTGSENEETIRTQLSVGYSREMTPRSRLTGKLQLSDRDVLGSTSEDQSVLRADLAYAHEIGQDWNLVSGYEYSRTDREILEDRKSSTLFLKLEKTFAYRP